MRARRTWLAWVAVALTACTSAEPTPAAQDSIAPTTYAFPPGGPYGEVQYVTLAGEEASTVYWSVDGVDPSPGASNTSSAEDPAFWIRIGEGTTTLKFFAVDRAGNREQVRTERYLVDTTPRAPWVAGNIAFREICPSEGGAGTVVLGVNAGWSTGPQELPFGYSLFGEPARTYWIEQKGDVRFEQSTAPWSRSGMLAPFFVDATIVACRLEEAQAVTIEWNGALSYNGYLDAPSVQFEVVLHDDGYADFVYGPRHAATSNRAIIGAYDFSGTSRVPDSDHQPSPFATPGPSFTLGLR